MRRVLVRSVGTLVAPAVPSVHRRSATTNSGSQEGTGVKSAAKPSPPGAPSAEDVDRIAAALQKDPKLLLDVMSRLEAEQRRRLIVAGGTMEWFGKENVAHEVAKADADNDRLISPKDFDNWFANALKRRSKQQSRPSTSSISSPSSPSSSSSSAAHATTTKSAVASAASVHAAVDRQAESENSWLPKGGVDATPHAHERTGEDAGSQKGQHANQQKEEGREKQQAESGEGEDSDYIPFATLLLVVVEAALPFVGFGFLDNAIMISAGDAIDSTLGFYMHCSVMASAAMGNVVSGAMGMQVHGLIDKMMQKLNIGVPMLTETQRSSRRVFLAGHVGGTIGIITGLSLGMLPLLFIKTDEMKSDYAMFHKWDRNKNGVIDRSDLYECLAELGLSKNHELADAIVKNYGKKDVLTVAQFSHLREDMRKGKAIFSTEPQHAS